MQQNETEAFYRKYKFHLLNNFPSISKKRSTSKWVFMFILAHQIQFVFIHSASNWRERLAWRHKYLGSMSSKQTPFQEREYITHQCGLSSSFPNMVTIPWGKHSLKKPALQHIYSLSICIRWEPVSIRFSEELLKQKWKRTMR